MGLAHCLQLVAYDSEIGPRAMWYGLFCHFSRLFEVFLERFSSPKTVDLN